MAPASCATPGSSRIAKEHSLARPVPLARTPRCPAQPFASRAPLDLLLSPAQPINLSAFVRRARLGRLRGHAHPAKRDHMVLVELSRADCVCRAPFRSRISLLHVPSAKQENTKPYLGRKAATPARPGKQLLKERESSIGTALSFLRVLTIFKIVFVGPDTS